jgi:hypothetical protein
VKKRQHHSFEAAPPLAAPSSHDLKAADLIVSKPMIGGKPSDNLSAASLTSGAPVFTAPTLTQTTPPKLKSAPRNAVLQALRDVYALGMRQNVNQVVAPVQSLLKDRGLYASKSTIQGIAAEPEFASQRNPTGPHLTLRKVVLVK